MGGDLINRNGQGNQCVYEKQIDFAAEKNNMKFTEPYLLVASANDEGRVGS
jgi:hypothetical protein